MDGEADPVPPVDAASPARGGDAVQRPALPKFRPPEPSPEHRLEVVRRDVFRERPLPAVPVNPDVPPGDGPARVPGGPLPRPAQHLQQHGEDGRYPDAPGDQQGRAVPSRLGRPVGAPLQRVDVDRVRRPPPGARRGGPPPVGTDKFAQPVREPPGAPDEQPELLPQALPLLVPAVRRERRDWRGDREWVPEQPPRDAAPVDLGDADPNVSRVPDPRPLPRRERRQQPQLEAAVRAGYVDGAGDGHPPALIPEGAREELAGDGRQRAAQVVQHPRDEVQADPVEVEHGEEHHQGAEDDVADEEDPVPPPPDPVERRHPQKEEEEQARDAGDVPPRLVAVAAAFVVRGQELPGRNPPEAVGTSRHERPGRPGPEPPFLPRVVVQRHVDRVQEAVDGREGPAEPARPDVEAHGKRRGQAEGPQERRRPRHGDEEQGEAERGAVPRDVGVLDGRGLEGHHRRVVPVPALLQLPQVLARLVRQGPSRHEGQDKGRGGDEEDGRPEPDARVSPLPPAHRRQRPG
ncbi:hypothetical protein THAOC_18843, partial [Thalassiosira oceanica]